MRNVALFALLAALSSHSLAQHSGRDHRDENTPSFFAGNSQANPQVCDLLIGDSCELRLSSGKTRKVTLLAYSERTEPYFEVANNDFVDAVVSAEVQIAVEGVEAAITGGPFHLPVEVNGVAVLVSATRGWIGGIDPLNLNKDVRLELKDASRPFYDPGRFVYPIHNYRWRALNYQNTWLALAVGQPRPYYHRGEDLGMIPDLEAVRSMTTGKIMRVPGPQGDGASNEFIIKDATGLSVLYQHMNTPHIRHELQPAVTIEQGEKLGLTGNTWQGGPVPGPHLHVEFKTNSVVRNSFPIIVSAYLNTYPKAVLPIAGGQRHLWKGQTIGLDGSLSIPSPGRRLATFEWRLTDGTSARAAKVSRRYDQKGAYSEQLAVEDNAGVRDLDFSEVYVLDPATRRQPPYGVIFYYPVRPIRPGTPVQFLIRYHNMKEVVIDFGDGTQVPYAEKLTHRYSESGLYVVTIGGKDDGSGPGTFKARVVVE